MRTYNDAKTMAKAMREALAAKNMTIGHSEALEIVAKQFGLDNWNILSARIETGDAGQRPRGEGAVAFEQAVPIVRIFDVARAKDFYLDFMGFEVDWEHRFSENSPLYCQISRAGLKLHLSEHSGDATPGGNMVVYTDGLRTFQKELIAKHYRYLRPGLEDQEWGLEMSIVDPFGNRIRFMERKAA